MTHVRSIRPVGCRVGTLESELEVKGHDCGPGSASYWQQDLGFFFFKVGVVLPDSTTSERWGSEE